AKAASVSWQALRALRASGSFLMTAPQAMEYLARVGFNARALRPSLRLPGFLNAIWVIFQDASSSAFCLRFLMISAALLEALATASRPAAAGPATPASFSTLPVISAALKSDCMV